MKTDPVHFFIVGAQRSGTTYLYNLLDQINQISLNKPARPEPKFFIDNYENAGIDEYMKIFASKVGANTLAYGEKSTSYYEIDQVPDRIKNFFPKGRIIFLLRNPVERAISNYFFSVENGLETRDIHAVFLDQEKPPNYSSSISVSPFNYLGRGMYFESVNRFIQKFGSDFVYVMTLEELTEDPYHEIKKLIEFLEIEIPSHSIESVNIDTGRNESCRSSSTYMEEITLNLQTIYREDVKKLEKLLERDFHNWKF